MTQVTYFLNNFEGLFFLLRVLAGAVRNKRPEYCMWAQRLWRIWMAVRDEE